jgi:hypothetical protein
MVIITHLTPQPANAIHLLCQHYANAIVNTPNGPTLNIIFQR